MFNQNQQYTKEKYLSTKSSFTHKAICDIFAQALKIDTEGFYD